MSAANAFQYYFPFPLIEGEPVMSLTDDPLPTESRAVGSVIGTERHREEDTALLSESYSARRRPQGDAVSIMPADLNFLDTDPDSQDDEEASVGLARRKYQLDTGEHLMDESSAFASVEYPADASMGFEGLDYQAGASTSFERAVANRSARPVANNMYAKTKLCRYYEMGICAKGTACMYVHANEDFRTPSGTVSVLSSLGISEQDLTSRPYTSEPPPLPFKLPDTDPAFVEQPVNPYFAGKSGSSGLPCYQTAADDSSASEVSPPSPERPPPRGRVPAPSPKDDGILWKTKMCRFYAQGMCSRGAVCSFAHTNQELRSTPNLVCTKICPRLVREGGCKDPACKYAHAKEDLRKLKHKAHGRRPS